MLVWNTSPTLPLISQDNLQTLSLMMISSEKAVSRSRQVLPGTAPFPASSTTCTSVHDAHKFSECRNTCTHICHCLWLQCNRPISTARLWIHFLFQGLGFGSPLKGRQFCLPFIVTGNHDQWCCTLTIITPLGHDTPCLRHTRFVHGINLHLVSVKLTILLLLLTLTPAFVLAP